MSNITEISKPTQWKPGQSGNLNGRPVGTRQAFSARSLLCALLAEGRSEEGRETMVKTVQDQSRLGGEYSLPASAAPPPAPARERDPDGVSS